MHTFAETYAREAVKLYAAISYENGAMVPLVAPKFCSQARKSEESTLHFVAVVTFFLSAQGLDYPIRQPVSQWARVRSRRNVLCPPDNVCREIRQVWLRGGG